MDQTTAIIAIASIAGIFLIAALYAGAYGLVARFGMGARLNWLRSYWASLIGLVLGFAFLAAIGMAVYYRGFSGWGYVAIAFGGLALVMTAINVLLVRTKDGEKINFIQGFMFQLVPNALMIVYSIATRPSY